MGTQGLGKALLLSTHNVCFYEELEKIIQELLSNILPQQVFFPSLTISQKHTYIILTLLNPTLYSKTGVYRGIHNFSYSAQKHRLWVLVRTASMRQF